MSMFSPGDALERRRLVSDAATGAVALGWESCEFVGYNQGCPMVKFGSGAIEVLSVSSTDLRLAEKTA